jgi:hypothetical protein
MKQIPHDYSHIFGETAVERWVGHVVDQRKKVGDYTLGCNGRIDLMYSR